MNIALVNMPFGSAVRPPLGVSTLKAELIRSGHRASVQHFALRFCDFVGLTTYSVLVDLEPSSLVAERVFARTMYGETPTPDEAFLSHLKAWVGSDRFALTLRAFRRAEEGAERFLDWCVRAVDWREFDAVGFSTTFAQTIPSLALARRLAEAFPDLTILFGGANCEDEMGLALHRAFGFVDFVCCGEADISLSNLIQSRKQGRTPSVPGVVARGSNGASSAEALSPQRVKDLDDLPVPDFSDYFTVFESRPRTFPREVAMETSRGCWWGDKSHCMFCGDNFPERFRAKSPGRAFAELEELVEHWAPERVFMSDDIMPRQYLKSFLPALAARATRPEIFYESKANLTRSEVELLAKAGVRRIQPGIESFSTPVLTLMRKGISASQNIQTLKWCRQFGVTPDWNILYGFPGESANDYEDQPDLFAKLHHLRPPMSTAPIRLDRFSPYFVNAESLGFRNVRAAAGYRHVFPFSEDCLDTIAYFFDADWPRVDHRQYGRALAEATAGWRHAAQRGAVLEYVDSGEALTFSDTRSNGEGTLSTLQGWERELYLHCDSRTTRENVEKYGQALGVEGSATQSFVDSCLDAKLMVEIDGRVLSLAVARADNGTT